MEVEYKRDLQNNYLVLKSKEPEKECNYMLKMAEENKIPGLLQIRSSRKNGILYINYEITSKQALNSIYEKKTMSGQEILSLLTGIKYVIEQMQSFLLNPLQLLLEPQFIYLGSDEAIPYLCYYPGEQQEEQIVLLAEFILKHLDHEDHDAVTIGYLFYQKANEKNFSMRTTLYEVLEKSQEQLEKNDTHTIKSNHENSQRDTVVPIEDTEHILEEELAGTAWLEEEKEVLPADKHGKKAKKKRDASKQHKHHRGMTYIHPFVLLSLALLLLLTGVAYSLYYIDLTQAGGIVMLTIAVECLLNKCLKKKKKAQSKVRSEAEADNGQELYELLKEELYDLSEEEKVEETQYLYAKDSESFMRLIATGGRNAIGMPDIFLDKEIVTIGKKDGGAEVILDSPTISRIHAQIIKEDGSYYLKDRNSRNGTFYNQERLAMNQRVELQNGDKISFADIEYTVVG